VFLSTKPCFHLTAGSQTPLSFEWVPSGVSTHRLFAVADRNGVVDEANRGNNLAWVDVVVGLKSPVLFDSGATGADPAYNPAFGYGYIDEGQPDVISACGGGALPEQTLRRDPNGRVLCKFDHLVPSHFYHLDVILYEWDSAGRQENVVVDGYSVAGPEDLGDGEVHRLSLLIDPALYVDRSLDIAIEASGINGSVVGAVNLHDVDYQYVDAGNIASDLAFSEAHGFGWMDTSSIANVIWDRQPSQSLRIGQTDDNDNLTYRFDRLKADSMYKIHLTFWQSGSTPILQKVFIDGIDTNLSVNSGDYLIPHETVTVPENTYNTDGPIEVTIQRLGANGAVVNEISLEEETLAILDNQVVTPTPYFSDVFGNVLVNVTPESTGEPAPIGTLIQAYDPRGVLVGAFTVTIAGTYGYLRIYGEDSTSTPPIPGMRLNELVSFRVNGAPAVAKPSFYWQNDHLVHRVDLSAGEINQQSILLAAGWNFVSFYYEPPSPLLANVLQSISNRYDRVLSEQGVFATELPPEFITLRELHTGKGYLIRTTGTTSVNLLVDGIHQPPDTPLQLHQGWNWIGYMPSFALPVADALQSITGKYQLIHSLYAVYNPADPVHSTLHTMSPGEGFMIYMDEAATLTDPSSAPGGNQAESANSTASLSELGVAPTPDFMTIYGNLQINGKPAPAGTVVQIVTPDGAIAGAAITEKSGVLPYTHVFGDPKGGANTFQPGEPLTFRVNGLLADTDVQLSWSMDELYYQVNLASIQTSVFLPLISRR
jgi:hypothetical protein